MTTTTKRRPIAAVVLAVLSGSLSLGAEPPAPVTEFALKDDRGELHHPAEWRGRRAVALLFLGRECPVSNGYAPEMRRIAETYTPRGVLVQGIHCDPDVTAEAARDHARDYGLPFPILLDPSQVLARQVGVTVTPEAVVLSGDGRVLYRGRIDDRYDPRGRRRTLATVHDLRDALEAVLDGRTPRPAAADEPFGCHLPRLANPAPTSSPH